MHSGLCLSFSTWVHSGDMFVFYHVGAFGFMFVLGGVCFSERVKC